MLRGYRESWVEVHHGACSWRCREVQVEGCRWFRRTLGKAAQGGLEAARCLR